MTRAPLRAILMGRAPRRGQPPQRRPRVGDGSCRLLHAPTTGHGPDIRDGGDAATYSSYQERLAQRKRQRELEKSANDAIKVLDNEHILAVQGAPKQVWPQLRKFMEEARYKIELDDEDLGAAPRRVEARVGAHVLRAGCQRHLIDTPHNSEHRGVE